MFLEPSASFLSSWFYLWILLTLGMRAGLRRWKRGIPNAGMQVRILACKGFVCMASTLWNIIYWFTDMHRTKLHRCPWVTAVTPEINSSNVSFFLFNKMWNILGLWVAHLTVLINHTCLVCRVCAELRACFPSKLSSAVSPAAQLCLWQWLQCHTDCALVPAPQLATNYKVLIVVVLSS